MEDTPILQMYHGLRGQHDIIPLSPQYKKALSVLADLEQELFEKLRPTPELLELFNKTMDAARELNYQDSADFYLEGFRFGAQIAMDIMKI